MAYKFGVNKFNILLVKIFFDNDRLTDMKHIDSVISFVYIMYTANLHVAVKFTVMQ